MDKTGPNERCPCGSGKKFKKCCQAKDGGTRYTREDRANAWAKLERFIEKELGEEDDDALGELWGRWLNHPHNLDRQLSMMSEHVGDLWFAFDRPLEDGRLVVDRFLDARGLDLSEGEKLYLRTLRASSMRLYEIEDSRPGESLTLRDLIEGDRVTVQERSGSRTLHRFEWIAARVVGMGASGEPEIEGVLLIPDFYHRTVRDGLRKERDAYLAAHPGATVESFYKIMPPSFHEVWVGAILEPYVPKLANTDGEEMVVTQVTWEVVDREAVSTALDKAEGLSRDEDEGFLWHWFGKNAKGEAVSLGLFKLSDSTLHLEANSIARGERGRALAEKASGAAIRHRGTTHEDMQRRIREDLRKQREEPAGERRERQEIPLEVRESLVLDQMARHYRKWLDEPVPALDGRSPREAVKEEAMRPRLIDLLHDLDRMYQRSLQMRAPAYDPSWIWSELGLEEEADSHPPPLAHERVAQLVPGSGALSEAVAEATRRQPGFKDAVTVVSARDARANLELQRFLREREADPAKSYSAQGDLAPYLERLVNFHLHRRKSFWVDEALAYMLAHTDLDVCGRELRLPFPSFALVFTDRHVLSLAERLLSRQETCVLAGQYLRVATVFVTEHKKGDERTVQICFALDALGADLPVLITYDIPLRDDQQVAGIIESLAPSPHVEPAVPNANPVAGLLQVIINAILYSTSAGVEPALRQAPARATGRPRVRGGPPITYSSDAVYFLPGAIEITQVRRFRELERVSSGRAILRRFIVRGHWRRAAASWSDQQMRWIQPYWKGPNMATIIERTYKLKP